MTLGEKQRIFTKLVAELIIWAYNNGYELTFAEAYRTPEQAKLNVKAGSGILNSLHTQRLAVDLNLFKNGSWLNKTEDHKPLGEHWEQMGKDLGLPLRWGGRFKDGNHYSFEHNGIK